MFCWYLRNTYLENKLHEPGATVQCGVPVDLARIEVPVYLLASREDHIVPWQTAFRAPSCSAATSPSCWAPAATSPA